MCKLINPLGSNENFQKKITESDFQSGALISRKKTISNEKTDTKDGPPNILNALDKDVPALITKDINQSIKLAGNKPKSELNSRGSAVFNINIEEENIGQNVSVILNHDLNGALKMAENKTQFELNSRAFNIFDK